MLVDFLATQHAESYMTSWTAVGRSSNPSGQRYTIRRRSRVGQRRRVTDATDTLSVCQITATCVVVVPPPGEPRRRPL